MWILSKKKMKIKKYWVVIKRIILFNNNSIKTDKKNFKLSNIKSLTKLLNQKNIKRMYRCKKIFYQKKLSNKLQLKT